jgi:acetyl-CoA synthetase
MSEKIYDVPAEWAKRAWIDQAKYKDMYARSISDPIGFWAEQARRIDWMKAPTKIENTSFAPGNVSIKWFEDGVLNVAWNCIDRHLHKRAHQTAIIWEGDDPSQSRHITYKELHDEVCRMANILRTRNVKKGDRVTIYLPMIPEAAYAMLACARIGAIHSVVFAGFSPDSLAQRINDCKSKVVITADEGLRGGKKVPLKANVDTALSKADGVDWVVVVKRTGGKVDMNPSRDLWYHEAAAMVTTECPAEHMHAEDPLFILYTSGSTGTPKGVLHTSGGYLVFAAMTHQYVFDYHDGDIYWCTADVGWVTGHSYILYGPLANGATTLMFEGVPNYPDNSRFWNVIDKHRVNIFYTAPTAIRALMQSGDEPVKKTSRASLRLLGSVGEPINPEAWEWYHRVVGDDRCPIVDTWWQTETGGILITPLPGATRLKPGSATQPFFGVAPEIVDADGKVLEGETSGNLCLTRSWPGQMRTVYGDHARFEQTYFSTYKGKYFTGDGCRRDADGYYWITGCAASCARSPRTSRAASATPRRWPIPPSSTTSSRTGRTARARKTRSPQGGLSCPGRSAMRGIALLSRGPCRRFVPCCPWVPTLRSNATRCSASGTRCGFTLPHALVRLRPGAAASFRASVVFRSFTLFRTSLLLTLLAALGPALRNHPVNGRG